MSNTPWSIQRSKRKQPMPSTSAPRKRARITDHVGKGRSAEPKAANQKTLTQITWADIQSTTSENGLDLQEIVHGEEKEEMGKRIQPRRGKMKKRDSTLTQMDWLGNSNVYQNDPSDLGDMLPEENTVGGEEPTPIEDPMPQVDGTFDSPRKKRKRKPEHPQKLVQSSSSSAPERDTQDYQPPSRKKRSIVEDGAFKHVRRRSLRNASKILSDPDENLEYMSNALLPAKDSRNGQGGRFASKSQIKQSGEPEHGEPLATLRPAPQTPRKQREIPSSQTPESLPRNSLQKHNHANTSPSKIATRRPLREISTNVPVLRKDTKISPKRSKVCVLKVPSRDLLPRSRRVEDSQRDLYSLQGSSSARETSSHSNSSNEEIASVPQQLEQDEPVEIPPTSQEKLSGVEKGSSPSSTETDQSLPDLSRIVPSRTDVTSLQNQHSLQNRQTGETHIDHHQADSDDSVVVQDFGHTASPHKGTAFADENEMLLGEDVAALVRTNTPPPVVLDAANDDTDSSFGSPIANDTQFVHGLFERTSSPDLTTGSVGKKHTSQPAKVSKQPASLQSTDPNLSDKGVLSAEEEDLGINTHAPLPVPRLVQHSPVSAVRSSPTMNGVVDEAADLFPSVHRNDSRTSTTKVPLNDTFPTIPSSSPVEQPSRSMTQRSVHPASMPHLSQISTQEPTQHYFFSSMPPPTQPPSEVERITIKDSNSVRLSQIPEYETQSQGLDLRLVDESDHEIDDLDLDPSSAPQPRESARKPSALLRKETSSTLKSIRMPSETSKILLSSSPPQEVPAPQCGESAQKPSILLKKETSSSLKSIHPSSPTKPKNPFSSSTPRKAPNTPSKGRSTSSVRKPGLSRALSSSPISSPDPPPLKRSYDPIPGFDNDTQSNFTQDGHITAAYVHRQRETGVWPDWFVPEPYQVSGAPPRAVGKRKRKDGDEGGRIGGSGGGRSKR